MKQDSQTCQARARKPFIRRPCPPLLLLVVRAWACDLVVRKTIGVVRLSHPSAFYLAKPTRISEETSLMARIQRHPPHHACGTHFHQNATNNHQNVASCCEHDIFHLHKKKTSVGTASWVSQLHRKFDYTSVNKWEIVNTENGGRILVENPHMKKTQRHNTYDFCPSSLPFEQFLGPTMPSCTKKKVNTVNVGLLAARCFINTPQNVLHLMPTCFHVAPTIR